MAIAFVGTSDRHDLDLDEKHLEHFFTRWNFEKFLVNHEGQPVRRYDESLDPSELVSSLFHR